MGSEQVQLTMAVAEYDHLRDLAAGRVPIPGFDLKCLVLPVEKIFGRFIKQREWQVSEMSMGKYAALVSQGDRSLSAIPVFPARLFRHHAIYVRADGPVHAPADLRGRKIGIPEWALTAVVYARAILMHEHGLLLSEIDWVQAGVNEPGGQEKVRVNVPDGIRLRAVADNTLDAMLVAGEIDALIASEPPKSFAAPNSVIRRLFSDWREAERHYWRTTGIFPIMHTVVIRADVLASYPGLPRALLAGFEEAKKRSFARLLGASNMQIPLPWLGAYAQDLLAEFGPDFWPYGFQKNLPTLRAFLRFAFEQGVCERAVEPEELFSSSVRDT
jgi:4,5-dihydroxyphthalate decarboxylase